MAYHIISVACLRAIEDRRTGLLSLIDVVDTASIDTNDPYLPIFTLLSKWGRSSEDAHAEELEIKISLSSPQISTKKEFKSIKITIPPQTPIVTLQIEMDGVPAKTAGVHTFHISYKDESMKRCKEAAQVKILLKK